MTLTLSRFRPALLGIVVLLLLLTPCVVVAQEKTDARFAGTWNVTAETDEGEKVYSLTLGEVKNNWQGSITNVEEEKTTKLDSVDIEGDQLTLEFKPHGEEIPPEAQLVVKTNLARGKLAGTWAVYMGGNEVAGGNVTATKARGLAGTWQSAAVLPDGTTLRSDLVFAGTHTSLTGKLAGEGGEIKLDEATLDGRNVELKFDYDVEGETRPIAISATWESANLLEGEWIMKGPGGEDVADGQWSATREPETIVLFDGKSLDQFRGYHQEEIGAGWKAEDGALYFDGTKGSGDIVTKQEFENFVFEFEWKVSEGGNSGVMYRVSLGDKKPYLTGPEYQVLDDTKHADGKNPSTSSGALYALYVPENKKLNAVGQWNTSKIVLEGNNVEHWLNGNKVVEAEIASDDWNKKVEASKFKNWEKFGKNKKGHLCFQDHGNKVWFRSIKVKVLSE